MRWAPSSTRRRATARPRRSSWTPRARSAATPAATPCRPTPWRARPRWSRGAVLAEVAPRVAVAPDMVVAADGVRLAAYRLGGYGPPLLLCHATGLHAHVWLPMLPVLRRHFTLYAFDLRGHGESEAPASVEAYHWRTLGDDVLAVADA